MADEQDIKFEFPAKLIAEDILPDWLVCMMVRLASEPPYLWPLDFGEHKEDGQIELIFLQADNRADAVKQTLHFVERKGWV